jgi:hypothetical protein
VEESIISRNLPTKKGKTNSIKYDWYAHCFDIQTVVHNQFIPQGKTVNQRNYIATLRGLQANVWQKQMRSAI